MFYAKTLLFINLFHSINRENDFNAEESSSINAQDGSVRELNPVIIEAKPNSPKCISPA